MVWLVLRVITNEREVVLFFVVTHNTLVYHTFAFRKHYIGVTIFNLIKIFYFFEDEDDDVPNRDYSGNVEDIVSRFEKEGVTMLDVVSILLNKFSKINEKYTKF